MLYRNKSILILFLGPTLLLLLSFLYYPFFSNILNSFYDLRGPIQTTSSENFIGLSNYKMLFTDPVMKVAFYNSIKMMILVVFFQVGLGLLLALLVNLASKGSGFFRTVYFFPIVISATAIGLMFNLFYDYYNGALNYILINWFDLKPVFWKSAETGFYAVALPVIWQYVGFYFVLFLTGITNIPDDIYEAADIDGANKFQQTTSLTIPLLAPVLKVCVILSLTGALKVFDLPWIILPDGSPKGITHMLGTYMYSQTFLSSNYDYGSTIAIVVVLLGIAISQVANFVMKDID